MTRTAIRILNLTEPEDGVVSGVLDAHIDQNAQLLNLSDLRAGKLLQEPYQFTQEDMDGLRPSRPTDGHIGEVPMVQIENCL